MKNKRLIIFFVIVCTLIPTTVFSNAAEPPTLTIVTIAPPDDLNMTMEINYADSSDTVELDRIDKAWERYFRYYRSFYPNTIEQVISVNLHIRYDDNESIHEIPIDSLKVYNSLMTYDLRINVLNIGQPAWRAPLLFFIRVGITLIVEGIIFYLFGYRDRKSWIIFLIVNLITQGIINYFIKGINIGSYYFIGYVLLELLIIFFERLAFANALSEKDRPTAKNYALVANLASLIIGGYAISNLPI